MSQDQPHGGGRAVGRARGRAKRQQPQEQVRRPGDERRPDPLSMQQQQQPGPAPIQAARSVSGGSGRAIQRGGVRSEQRPGDVEALTRAVASAQISGESAGRGTRRGRQEIYEPVTRPEHVADKRGKTGKKIEVYSNYFKVLSRPNWRIYQYHVDFAPTVESSRMRRGLLHDHKDLFGPCYLFDGMSDIKSLVKLRDEITEVYSRRRTDDENIQITIKRVAELAPNHPEVNRLFNTQMRRNLQHLEFLLLGRHFFDKSEVSEIPEHGIELWRGVLTSIQEHETGMMMAVDTVHKVLRRDTVLDQMTHIAQEDARNYKDNCIKKLAGAIVMTRYNNRTYRIEDIDFDKDPTHTFEMKNERISYMQYYKRQYDITIRDGRQPLLLCKSRQRELRTEKSNLIYLIPELCCMTGITDEMRADFRVMRDLSKHTRLEPDRRVSNLLTFINRINRHSQIRREMDGWGIKFADELVKMEARVVQSETILHKSAQSTYDPSTADFSREMRGKSMFVSIPLTKWILITPSKERSKAEDFVQTLRRVCPPMGMQVSPPDITVINDVRPNTYISAMRSTYNPGIQMIVTLVPNTSKDRYDAIKKLGCVDLGVPTQVIVARTLSKKQMLMSVATKIGIQLNCKLGGEAWAVNIPLSTPLMVIGFDTYHDSSRKGHSVGGFVASLNKSLTRWYSQVSFHQTGGWQEMSDTMSIHMTRALQQFHKCNRTLPQIILFYRDGVSDGQIRYVLDHELKQIQSVLSKTYSDPVRFAFVIVNKRISTRFFKTHNNGFANPPPGTIVDSEVTRPGRYDFFLVSQSVSQGTVSPTQYNVIFDTSGLPPEHIQRLTYKLCHLYFNWPGTIRVPAPCQYAHKLAFLSGQSLHKDHAEQLADTLFYL
ncbi:piwi-like protein 1 [Centruroides vittatus]|uniref:piwi-like protein 1 n=1 Tax=Centruroides vittatus TaxID=120091 RepID=UPI003510D12C